MSASDDMVCRLYVNKRQMSYSGPMARNRLARLDEYVASPGYLSTLGWKDNGLRSQDFGGGGGFQKAKSGLSLLEPKDPDFGPDWKTAIDALGRVQQTIATSTCKNLIETDNGTSKLRG